MLYKLGIEHCLKSTGICWFLSRLSHSWCLQEEICVCLPYHSLYLSLPLVNNKCLVTLDRHFFLWLISTSIPISFSGWHQIQISSFFKLFQVDMSKIDSSLHKEKILIDIGPYVKYYNHRFWNIPSAFICNIHWSCKKKEKNAHIALQRKIYFYLFTYKAENKNLLARRNVLFYRQLHIHGFLSNHIPYIQI